jgi:hypothetical protein
MRPSIATTGSYITSCQLVVRHRCRRISSQTVSVAFDHECDRTRAQLARHRVPSPLGSARLGSASIRRLPATGSGTRRPFPVRSAAAFTVDELLERHVDVCFLVCCRVSAGLAHCDDVVHEQVERVMIYLSMRTTFLRDSERRGRSTRAKVSRERDSRACHRHGSICLSACLWLVSLGGHS